MVQVPGVYLMAWNRWWINCTLAPKGCVQVCTHYFIANVIASALMKSAMHCFFFNQHFHSDYGCLYGRSF